MAQKEPGERQTGPSETDWIPDPSATVPGVSLEAVWTDEHESLEKAILGDKGDWKSIAASTAAGQSERRTWDAKAGEWRSDGAPKARVPDPTTVGAEQASEPGDAPLSFGFPVSPDEHFVDDFETAPSHAMPVPPQGLIARILAKLGL